MEKFGADSRQDHLILDWVAYVSAQVKAEKICSNLKSSSAWALRRSCMFCTVFGDIDKDELQKEAER
jgi:hypothetical protein